MQSVFSRFDIIRFNRGILETCPTKKKLSPKPLFYPKPAVLVGARVRGRPNFLVIANCGIARYNPPWIFIASHRGHHTNLGIRKEKTFSVNFPSVEMAAATDYCGMFSGQRVDKSKLFEVFYGELETAPLIRECPVNLECRLVKTLKFEDEDLFLGEILAICADSKCLTRGRLDIEKINPLIYSTSDRKYFRIGKEIGRTYCLGVRKKRD